MVTTEKEFLRSDIAVLRHQLTERHQRLLAIIAKEHGLEWEQLTDRLAILHNPQQRSGWSQMGYIGFMTQCDAEKCAQILRTKGLLKGMKIRKAKRLKACNWEIKAMDIDPEVMRCLSDSEKKHQLKAWSETRREVREPVTGTKRETVTFSKEDSKPESYKIPEQQNESSKEPLFFSKGGDELGKQQDDNDGGFPLW